MNKKTRQVMMSSDKMDWRTPPEMLDIVRQIGPIGLDPCAPNDNNTGAKTFFTADDDGLQKSWAGHGLVFVNPPYGRALKPWMAKMAREGTQATEIVALVPVRTDTAWWQDNVSSARRVCFYRGRIKFLDVYQAGIEAWPPDTSDPAAAEYIYQKFTKNDLPVPAEAPSAEPAPFPTQFIYWGSNPERFEEVFMPHGIVIEPKERQ